MSALMLVGSAFVFLWALWGAYVLVMGLYRAHLDKRLTKFTYTLSVPFLLLGYAMDIVANILIATVLFMEWPIEWLVTDRLSRLMGGTGWRSRLAAWICKQLLDVFDPKGTHCR